MNEHLLTGKDKSYGLISGADRRNARHGNAVKPSAKSEDKLGLRSIV